MSKTYEASNKRKSYSRDGRISYIRSNQTALVKFLRKFLDRTTKWKWDTFSFINGKIPKRKNY